MYVYAAKWPITSVAVTRQRRATGRCRMIVTADFSWVAIGVVRSRGSTGRSGSTSSSATTQIAPAAARTAIVTRQPRCWPSRVPSGTPSTMARELPRKASAVAFPAWPGGASRAVTGPIADQKMPWARAQTIRARTSRAKVGANAAASWETAKIATIAAISRCRGMRMVSAVSGIVVTPATTA